MTSKHNVKHHTKRNVKSRYSTLITIILILVVLIIASLLFFKPFIEKNKYGVYNNFEFEQSEDYWQTKIQYNQQVAAITFTNHPLDLEDIEYDSAVTEYILEVGHRGFVIALRNDSGSVPVIAGINIARVLGEKFFGFEVRSALYFDDEIKDEVDIGIPVVSCSDATEGVPIIFIDVKASKKSIKFSEDNPNCIILSSESPLKEDVLKLADLFDYKLLEIM